jgi:hypothetical protein
MTNDLNPPQQGARTLLVRCGTTGDALHHQRHAVLPPLALAVDDAAEALAAVDTAQALALAAGDDAALTQAEQQSEQCASALDTARVAQVRQQRVEAALAGHLQAAEAELAATVPGLRDAVVQHQPAQLLDSNQRLQRAAQAYVDVLRQIASEASAAGNMSMLRTLDEVTLPDLSAPIAPWVCRGRVKLADSTTVALGTDAIDATLAAELSGPRRLLAEVTGYVPFSVREAGAARPVGSWAGTNGGVPITPTVAAEDAAPARTTTTTAAAAMPAARRGRSAGSAVRLA